MAGPPEKQYRRNRVKKLGAALQAVQEGRALPENEEMQWPGGTWQRGLRGGKNVPSEFFCQSLEGRGRCQGTKETEGSREAAWQAKPAHLAHRPPSHIFRSSRRSKEAKVRQRKAA
eukprot:8573120-Alexandrium_andersonii.AAC.1